MRLLVLLLLLSVSAVAQNGVPRVEHVRGRPVAIGQWEVVDLTFEAHNLPVVPFRSILQARVTAPDGREFLLPGFFDGESSYIIRFSGDMPGDWKWITRSELPALAGLTGRFEVAAMTRQGRHGALVTSGTHLQAFEYEDGTPAPVLAAEIDWIFALDLQNENGEVPKTERLLDHVADAGINQVVFNVYAHDVSWEKDRDLPPRYDYGSPAVWPYGGSNDEPDYSTLNTAFFDHIDRVVMAMHEREITAHMMIYVWNKLVNWPTMRSTADNMYFDYVVSRYQAFPNLVWDISKEALGYGHDDITYIDDRIERLRKLDGYGRLVSVHDYHYCSSRPGKVDFITIQTWTNRLYDRMREVRERHADKPILNIEHGGYEAGPYHVFNGDYLDPLVCLERNYVIHFAGAYSTYYWQDMAWNVIVDDIENLPEEDRPKLAWYGHLANFLRRYGLDRMSPASDLGSSGYALVNDDETRFIYWKPSENERFAVTLPEHARLVNVTWFHPLTGEYIDKGVVELNAWHSMPPPWANVPCALVLEVE